MYKVYIEETVYATNTVDNGSENKVINGVIEQTMISSNQSTSVESSQSITLSPSSVSGNNPQINTPSNSQSNTGITYKYNNKYYYNQLDNYAKAIYDAIANNIGNLKYGNYQINIDYDFSNLLSQENGEKSLDNSYNDAVNALNLDIPSIFYIDFSKMSLNIETTTNIFETKYKLYLDAGKNINYYNSLFTSQAQVESAILQVENIKSQICNLSNGTEYEKLRKSHDWLIENMEYEASSDNRGNVYGALIEKKAVCEGYARVYKYVLDELGMNSVLITGTATNSKGVTEDHMWNYVQIDNVWYAVDITWDDPIVQGGGKISTEIKHKYFLIGSKELFKTHEEKRTISKSEKIFNLPILSDLKY